MSPQNVFQARPFPGCLLIEFTSPSLQELNAANLAEDLLEALQDTAARRIYLNFSGVRRVAEQVWRELLDLNRFLHESGERLCLVNLCPSLSQQLRRVEYAAETATREFEIAS